MGDDVRDEKGHFQNGNPGRPKGAVNRFRTVAANNPLRYDGRNPAEELHRIGFDEKESLADRTRALAAAAPFFTPKAPQYIRAPIEVPLIKSVGDALSAIARLTSMAANQEVGLDEARMLITNIKDWVAAYQTNNLELLVARIQAELRGEPAPPLLADLPALEDGLGIN